MAVTVLHFLVVLIHIFQWSSRVKSELAKFGYSCFPVKISELLVTEIILKGGRIMTMMTGYTRQWLMNNSFTLSMQPSSSH